MTAASVALARRTFLDSRTRNVAFAYLFVAATFAQVYGYRHTYSTLADRLRFAHSFGDNKAVRLLYGEPHDLLTVGGYAEWRAGGSLAILAGLWGLLAAVRAMRAEEEAGRMELVLSGTVSRRAVFAAQVTGIGAWALGLCLAAAVGLVAGRLNVGSSALLALGLASAAVVFAGVGAVTSQLGATRRQATGLAAGVLVVALALRVVADTSGAAGWVRWTTPLGWVEELRPFSGARPAVLLLPALTTAALLAVAAAIAVRRDIGQGLLPAHDEAPPRLGLLRSPATEALREQRGALAGWLLGLAGFALIVGLISNTVTSGLSGNVERQLAKLGAKDAASTSGYLGFSFLFFVVAISLFCCGQVTAARREEAEQRLETLLALPVGRRGWLAGRVAVGAGAAAALALATGFAAWAGAASQHAGVSLGRMLEAGANCLPAALLFLALGVLAFAVVPRASAAVAYGLVAVAFLWDLLGELLGAPSWLLAVTPFRHVGLVPAESFKALDAAVMLALAGAAALAAAAVFARRDLVGN